MSMSIQAPSDLYAKWEKAQQHLKSLESLQDNQDQDLWQNYRLLPHSPMYLVSAHFGKKELTPLLWSIKTKWDLFALFDKSFKSHENLPKAREAIKSAIQDQRNIVSLRELYAIVSDPSKQSTEKTAAYFKMKQTNSSLFDQIKHCIGKRNKIAVENTEELLQGQPDSKQQKQILTQMIWVLKQGYENCIKHDTFF